MMNQESRHPWQVPDMCGSSSSATHLVAPGGRSLGPAPAPRAGGALDTGPRPRVRADGGDRRSGPVGPGKKDPGTGLAWPHWSRWQGKVVNSTSPHGRLTSLEESFMFGGTSGARMPGFSATWV